MSTQLRPFIYGLKSSVLDAPFLSTRQLYDRVGHNTGNLAYHFAIESHLGAGLPVVSWGAGEDQINAAGEVGVLPCANQLGAHVDLAGFANVIETLDLKFVAIGLGAQAGINGEIPEIPLGTLRWVRRIADRSSNNSKNIAVRGEFTLKVLEHYGCADKAQVLGCPTLFINPATELGKLIQDRLRAPKRIAIASGNIGMLDPKLEASLAALVNATQGSYIAQSAFEMLALCRADFSAISEDTISKYRSYICPEMDVEEFKYWISRFGTLFSDVPSWMEHLNRFDFVIGPRIHGVMLALQAGVPALCIVHDMRTLEMCQTMKVPYVLASNVANGIQRKDLLDLFNFNADEFDANRRELASNYIQFLKNNLLKPTVGLERLAR